MFSKVICFFILITLFFIGEGFTKKTSPELAPPFSAITLKGEKISFDPITRQKPLLMIFWASWCQECRYETPEIKELYRKDRHQLEVLGISVDKKAEKAESWIQNAEISYPNILDSEAKVSGLFKVRATPTIILIDQTGKVRYRGYRLDKQFRMTLKDILDTSS